MGSQLLFLKQECFLSFFHVSINKSAVAYFSSNINVNMPLTIHQVHLIVLVDRLMTPDLQSGGHRQHGGPQQQVSHGQVDYEVVRGDPQVSVADHRQDNQNVADDGEQDEEGQHHAHRHRPAQVQRGGDMLCADAAVDGRIRSAGKIRRGAVPPVTHGEKSAVTSGERTRN